MKKITQCLFAIILFSNAAYGEFCVSQKDLFQSVGYEGEGSNAIIQYITCEMEKVHADIENKRALDVPRDQENYQLDILKRLHVAVEKEVGKINHEQRWLRRFHENIIIHGLGLGVYSADLKRKLENPRTVFSVSEFENISDDELVVQIGLYNESYTKLVSVIKKGVMGLCTPGELEKIRSAEKRKMEAWAEFQGKEILDGKTYPQLLGSDGSYEDTLLRHINADLALRSDVLKAAGQNRRVAQAFDLLDEVFFANAEYQRELGMVLVKNPQLFRDESEALNSLCEKRAVLEALRVIRTETRTRDLGPVAKQIAETHSHGGENGHVEATKGQQQGQ